MAGVEWVVVPFHDRGQARSLLSRSPVFAHRFATPQIRRAFDDLVRERPWDAIVIDHLAMAGVVTRDRRSRLPTPGPLLVYVSHNYEEGVRAQLAAGVSRRSLKRLALGWDAAKTARLERGLVDATDLVTVITDDDGDQFRRHTPDSRYLLLTPAYEGSGVATRTIDAATPRRITLLGSYASFTKQLNLWRFLDVGAGPLARAGIGIDVVGLMPDDFSNRLRTAFPDVTVTGQVDRVEPHLAKARMGVVAEGLGGGFKLKVLDYVFNRLPVASLAGSVAGTPLLDGESILEFPDLARLVEGVIATIDDLPRLNAVQEVAFRACDGRFAWADRGRALVAALSGMRIGA